MSKNTNKDARIEEDGEHVTFRAPKKLKDRLDAYATKYGISRTDLIIAAIRGDLDDVARRYLIAQHDELGKKIDALPEVPKSKDKGA